MAGYKATGYEKKPVKVPLDKARYRIRHEYTTLGAGAAYSRQKGRLWLRHEYTTLGPALHTRARRGCILAPDGDVTLDNYNLNIVI